jgi:transposase
MTAAWMPPQLTPGQVEARRLQAFLATHRTNSRVTVLPPYAPDLNPEEQCNAVVKRALANALPRSVEELRGLARRALRRLQRHPAMIRHFFHHAGLHVNRH